MKCLISILILLTLISCEQEIGRVDLINDNSKEIFFLLAADDEVSFYADIDIQYKEKPLFVYECEAYQGGLLLFKGGTDPLNTKNNQREEKNVVNGITNWKFYGKLEGTLKANMDGEYSVKTTFVRNEKEDLKIKKAEIVFIK